MTLTNPSLVLSFVGSQTIPDTTVSNSEIVRQSIEIDWQMMSNLKSTSDKAKISITKESVAVSRIMSFDGDIKAVLKDGDTVLFTGFLSNKYKWSVTNHGEQVLSLTIEDNTRLLETIYSDKDQLIDKEFYIPARVGHPVASGVLVDIATICGISLDASVPEIDVDIIKTVSADTECVDIIDQVCFELGYCYKFKADGKLYLWQIAKGNEPVSATLTKDSLYAVQENAVIVNKSLKQYNRAIVKYTDISTRSNTLIYQDISGQDDTHAFCHIEVRPGFAYPSGLAIAGHTDDQLRAVCEATDLSEGKTIIGIGDTITPEFICTASGISADIRKYSANSVSVLVKNTLNVPIYIEKLQAKASITYEEGESKVYAGSVSDKKYYETSLEYIHDNDTASKLGNLIYQFYKHSNLAYTFYSKTQLALGDIIMLQENQYSGVNAKLMINAIVDSSATGVYQYVGYSFTPFNLQEGTSTNSKGFSPTVIPGPRGADGQSVTVQYALSDSPDVPPILLYQILGSASDEVFGSSATDEFGTIDSTESQWQPSVPYPVAEGMYIWMRTSTNDGVTWAYSRLTGEAGEDGGEYVFKLHVARSTFNINRRDSGNQTIAVYCDVVGYPSSAVTTITALNATYSNGYITLPLNNNYSSVTVYATLTDSGEELASDYVNLDPVDITEAPMFLGCLSALPTTTPNNEQIIDGDYFCVKATFSTYEKGDCYRMRQGSWVKMTVADSQASEMLNCLNGFKQEGVALKDISSHDAIAWFNQIVADQMILDTIKGNNAFFENIEIGGTSTFYGKIDGDVLKTVASSSSTSTYISDGQNPTGTFLYEDVASYITNSVSKTSGTIYSASGTIAWSTASQFVYFSGVPTGSSNITSFTIPTTGSKSITAYTTQRKEKLRITATMAGSQDTVLCEIYNGSSLQKTDVIISDTGTASATYTTDVLQAGLTIVIRATGGGGEAVSIDRYNVDNFDTGSNIVTNNAIYNLGRSGSVPTVTYLQGTGSNLNLEYVYSGSSRTLVKCNSSTWTSGIPKYSGFTGKTSGTAANAGNGSISSISATVTYSNGTSPSGLNSADSVEWGASYIKLFSNGTCILSLDASTQNLASWYISITVRGSTSALTTAGISPFSGGNYSLGTSSNKWYNGYFSNLTVDALDIDELSVTSVDATTLYGTLIGDVGKSNNPQTVYTDYLVANNGTLYEKDSSGSELNVFRPNRNAYSDYDNYSSSSSRSISLGSIFGNNLPVNCMYMYSFTGNNATSVTFPSGGTYKYVAMGSSANTNDYGARAHGGSISGSGSVSFGYSSQSRPYGYIIIFWRYS